MNESISKILIIDDDSEIRYSLDRVLKQEGHTLLSADSGETGIEQAKKEKPNLIFLDNRMGGISGIETLQHLRTASPDSLVILMTAYGTTQTAIEAMKHGAFDYVLKPFDLNKLKENILFLNQEKYDFVFYIAGVDIHLNDRLGKLKISEDGIKRRDEMIINNFFEKNVPICGVLGGGYNKDFETLVRLHAILHKTCASVI